LIRRLIAFRPSRDTLLPNRGLLPQISQTADTETPIPYVIASGGRATKRSVVARADVMLGAKPPTMQARRDRPNPEKSAVRRSERMQDTSARGPMLLLISRTSATRALALIGPIKSGSQVRDRTRPGPRCRHLRLEQQGSTVPPPCHCGRRVLGHLFPSAHLQLGQPIRFRSRARSHGASRRAVRRRHHPGTGGIDAFPQRRHHHPARSRPAP
jgi:hypothetical protein